MTESTDTFLDRVQNLVESEDFFDKLIIDINKIDNYTNKSKLLLELISYVAPRMKTVDSVAGKSQAEINITFSDAEPPKTDSESLETPSEASEEV